MAGWRSSSKQFGDRLDAALGAGALAIPHAEGMITIAGGAARLVDTIRTPGAELGISADVDLGAQSIDATLRLSGPQGLGPADIGRPEIAIALQGPTDSPRRTLDVAALTSWLSSRAIALNAKRLEAAEAARNSAGRPPQARAQPQVRADTQAALETPPIAEPPAKAEPLAKVEPPAKAEPLAKVEPPAKAEPLAKVEPPAKAEPLAKVEPPAKAEPLAKVEPPARAEPLAKVEPPAKAEPLAKVEPPAKAEPLAKVEPPTKVEPPAKVETQPKVEMQAKAEKFSLKANHR